MGIRGRIWRDPGAGGCTPSVDLVRFISRQIKLPGGPFCFGSSDIDLWGVVTPVSLPAFLALCDRLSNLLEPQHALGRIIDLYLLSESEAELRGPHRIPIVDVASHSPHRCGSAALSHSRRDRNSRGSDGVMYRFMNMSRMVMRAPLDAHQTRILSKSLLNIDQEWRRRPSGFAGSRSTARLSRLLTIPRAEGSSIRTATKKRPTCWRQRSKQRMRSAPNSALLRISPANSRADRICRRTDGVGAPDREGHAAHHQAVRRHRRNADRRYARGQSGVRLCVAHVISLFARACRRPIA